MNNLNMSYSKKRRGGLETLAPTAPRDKTGEAKVLPMSPE